MSDDRRQRRREEPRDSTRASAPDVQVFSLPELEQPAADDGVRADEQPRPPRGPRGGDADAPERWMDEARTAIWEDSRPVEQPPADQPIKRRETRKLPAGPAARTRSASKPPASKPSVRASTSTSPSTSPSTSTSTSPSTSPSTSTSTPTPAPGSVRRGGSASRLHDAQDVPFQPVPAGLALARTSAAVLDVEEEAPEHGGAPHLLEAPPRVSFNAVAQIFPDPRLWVMTRPASAAAEQYRVLALNLREARSLRVIAFVAPTAQAEGSLAASNVCLALAEGGRNNVLLLDANLRHPEVAALFGLQEGVGLGEQLRRHRRAPEDPWQVCAVSPNLYILQSGAVDKNPSALLSSDALPDLIAEARRAFDYTVVAAPPVIESADINILQDYFDGAVLVVKARVTKRDSVTASVARLGAAKLRGVVLVDA